MALDKITTRSETKPVGATAGRGSPPRAPEVEPKEAKSFAVTLKETLESIVVAFILAFVFRAFIVEAFVIPTGSMAVTLYGKQLTKTCSTCGYEYALGVSDGPAPNSKKSLCCPNCRMTRDDFTSFELGRPDSGDRILVHKWPLDLPGNWLGPKRWDVTVFKDPEDGKTNFIKRLVGLPGEVLEVIDGDVYAASMDKLPKDLLDQFDELRRQIYRYGHNDADPSATSSAARDQIRSSYAQINKSLLPYLQIQRKIEQAPRAQQSLWFSVYNHDFLPNYDLRSDQRRPQAGWSPDTPAAAEAWKDTSQRTIKFNPVGNDALFLRFDGVVDDFYAYNNDGAKEVPDSPGGISASRWLVGDLRLRFSWVVRAGSGDLILEMNRDKDKFIATLSVGGKVRLETERPMGETAARREFIAEKTIESFARERAVRVEFVNVDYRVLVIVDDTVIIRTNDEQYRPSQETLARFCQAAANEPGRRDVEVIPSQVRIGGHNLQCEIMHLALERDVYYRSQHFIGGPWQIRGQQKYAGSAFQDWPGWGTAGYPICLRGERKSNGAILPAEYFMLGDNSPQSKDSRLWAERGEHLIYLADEYQLGTVPEDQLIGKAFFVYWPAGHRATWTGGIGLIPNFGRMRWIR